LFLSQPAQLPLLAWKVQYSFQLCSLKCTNRMK
jgi:hypothetical protein